MKYQYLLNKLSDLQIEVEQALKKEIAKSKTLSNHISTPCLKVDVFGYTELVVVNNRLVFLDNYGYHYSLYADCELEDLLDILNRIEE